MRMTAPAATIFPPCSSADRKSTRLNSSHSQISYAVFCLKKKTKPDNHLKTSQLISKPDQAKTPSLTLSLFNIDTYEIHDYLSATPPDNIKELSRPHDVVC